MKAALFASCAPAVGAFRCLENHCTGKIVDLRFAPEEPSERELVGTTRQHLLGGAVPVIAFGDEAKHDKIAFRIARVAVRASGCALVMTSAGYRRFSGMHESLMPVDWQHLTHSVSAIVRIGAERGADFVFFEEVFPRAKLLEVGGFSWAPKSCEKIVEHISRATNGGFLV